MPGRQNPNWPDGRAGIGVSVRTAGIVLGALPLCLGQVPDWQADLPITVSVRPSMKTKSVIELSDAQRMAAAAQTLAMDNQWAVCIAIVDDGGHLLHLQRLDGAAATASYIATSKAQTAALGRRESKVYEDMVNGGRMSFLSAPLLQGLLEGGVPVMVDGQCVGAIGVSGVKSSEDAQIARAGIAAL